MKHLVHRIVICAAATIAGRKQATLMNIFNDNGGLLDAWDRNRADIFSRSEIDYYELKRTYKNAIVLFFNHNQLDGLLRNESLNKFLSECGYESGSIEHTLSMLRRRYATVGCPREIGVFLGIPLKDDKEFMGLNSLRYTKYGMWRIYGDPAVSEKRMNEYRCARNMIRRRLISGEDPVRIIRGKEFGLLNEHNFIREDYLRTY